MNRSWTSSILAPLFALTLLLVLPACGGESEGGHSHGDDSHTHEQAASHENGDHAHDGDHAHEDSSKTRLDTSGMDADSTHGGEGGRSGDGEEHSHDGEEHSHGSDEHSHQ